MSTIPLQQSSYEGEWKLPSRGHVGMYSFIAAESAIFTIFVVAYIYFIGRSAFGPTPQVLRVPIFNTVCLLSSSLTIWLAERKLAQNAIKSFVAFWFFTFALGAIFLAGTAMEWRKLIFEDGLTVRSNVFGTTYYSLVGLHASHVTAGLSMILLVLIFAITGRLSQRHAERVQVLALYWHFVDAVWVVVFTVVYVIGR
jgi:cytochrome c oxidase subunit 3/cytochrome o ubiquinol oxidase subunit 3